MPESGILRGRFVLERSPGDHWGLVAFRDVHGVSGIRHFDARWSSVDVVMDWMMGGGRHYSVYSEVPVGYWLLFLLATRARRLEDRNREGNLHYTLFPYREGNPVSLVRGTLHLSHSKLFY